MSNFADLIERLEQAEGPDRVLDAHLHYATTPILQTFGSLADWLGAGASKSNVVPAYSASLEAAIALVEKALPGWHWSIYGDDGCVPSKAECQIEPPEHSYESHIGRHVKPAIAVCAALLRALDAQAQGGAER